VSPAGTQCHGQDHRSANNPLGGRASTLYEHQRDEAAPRSSGPWPRNFDPATGKGTIFGVTSRGTMTEDGVTLDLTSAVFTEPVRKLYERAGQQGAQ
jgi:hypothetical protein